MEEEENKDLSIEKFEPKEIKQDAICKLITGCGTGFFCKITIKKKPIKLLFTTNDVLNENQLKNGSKIKIKHNNILKYIEINYKRFTCTNEELNYSCIEIFEEDNFENFFEIDSNIFSNNPEEEYKKEEIKLIQFPKGKEIEILNGSIKHINNFEIIHNINSLRNSSGTPIILKNRNCSIIGIHLGSLKDDKGIYFKVILDDIEKQKKNLTKYKPIKQIVFKKKIYDLFTKDQFVEFKEKWLFFFYFF